MTCVAPSRYARVYRGRAPRRPNVRYSFGRKENPTRLKVEVCPMATEEHRESRRQFAHVFHRSNVICVSQGFFKLPETHRLGLLLHEVGHVLAGQRGSEDAANRAAYEASGIRIYYKDSKFGPELEWIEPGQKQQARQFLGLN